MPVRKVICGTIGILACAALFACGPKPKPPVTGADLVATAVAAHYELRVDGVRKTDDGYEWVVSAFNGSDYYWSGTLYIKLVDATNEIIESHDFEIKNTVPPGGKTMGLKFTSPYAPVEKGGTVAALKAEVDVATYEETAGR
jgi:hypothetical protein